MSKAPAKTTVYDEIGSFTCIPDNFINDAQDLTDSARWLFVLLRMHTNGQSGRAFPSYETIQQFTKWSRATISSAIKQLEKTGWLSKQRAFGGVNQYTLHGKPQCTKSLKNEPLQPVQEFKKQGSTVQNVDAIKIESNQTEFIGVVTPKTPPVNNLVNSIINGAGVDCETVPANENLPEENRADQDQYIASSEMLEKGSDGLKRRARPIDPFWQIFAAAFLATYDLSAPSISAGFVQLAKLRKQQDGTLTETKWRRAVENYFATPQSNHTLADLCVRFASFYKHPLDRFGKPVEATAADQDDSDPTGLRRLARQLAAPYGIL